jgi:starch synthase
VGEADIVHCHTWYSHLAGCLVKQLTGAKLVLTTHSLEPHRPWKVEQLGTAYHASTWVERTAYQNADGVIAVSESMKSDVNQLYGVAFDKIRVIYNGIDLDEYRNTSHPDVLASYGVNPNKPFILFVGRITRQKGIIHLVNALKYLHPHTQVVLCAGAPDTEEIGREMGQKVDKARAEGQTDIVWISKILPKKDVIALYSHASVFVCPSVYEPFGIINLEAMACETPVVASAVGGIPEIVVPGETGFLVRLEQASANNFEPKDPEQFSQDLATHLNNLLESPERVRDMGLKSRQRVEQYFSWASIAKRTLAFYEDLLKEGRG